MERTRVKICGITNVQDALAAVEAGADYLGFIFYPKSPRYVTPTQARAIVEALRAERGADPGQKGNTKYQGPKLVGVFVNVPLDQVLAVLEATQLDYAQLHGEEPPTVLEALAGRGYKAIRPTSLQEALELAHRYGPLGSPDGPQLLLDAHVPNAYGGTGHPVDWEIAAAVAARCPRLLLAGGLTPANVAQAVRTVRPWGVDVSSGVERAPGQKDPAAIQAFVAQARTAGT